VTSAIDTTNGTIQISRAALSHNYRLAQQLAGNCEIIVVVKSNGYGVGAEALAKHLSSEGARNWAVSNIAEAMELRRTGIKGEILLLGHLEADDSWFEHIHQNDCCLSVSCLEEALLARDWTRRSKRTLRVHLQMEIGMKRLGIAMEQVDKVASAIRGHRLLQIEGAYGHPPSSHFDGLISEHRRFEAALQKVKQYHPLVSSHFASSAALACGVGLDSHQYVRLGISLLGGLSSRAKSEWHRPARTNDVAVGDESQNKQLDDWRSVVRIVSRVVQIQRLHPGESVSYGGDFCARRSTLVAVVPVGYADGIPTGLSNQLIVNVRNTAVKQIGRITMNYLMLDVTDMDGLQVGELVSIGDSVQPFHELARMSGHLPHELLARLSPRAPRCLA